VPRPVAVLFSPSGPQRKSLGIHLASLVNSYDVHVLELNTGKLEFTLLIVQKIINNFLIFIIF